MILKIFSTAGLIDKKIGLLPVSISFQIE